MPQQFKNTALGFDDSERREAIVTTTPDLETLGLELAAAVSTGNDPERVVKGFKEAVRAASPEQLKLALQPDDRRPTGREWPARWAIQAEDDVYEMRVLAWLPQPGEGYLYHGPVVIGSNLYIDSRRPETVRAARIVLEELAEYTLGAYVPSLDRSGGRNPSAPNSFADVIHSRSTGPDSIAAVVISGGTTDQNYARAGNLFSEYVRQFRHDQDPTRGRY